MQLIPTYTHENFSPATSKTTSEPFIFSSNTPKCFLLKEKGNLLGTLIEVIIGQFLLVFGREDGGNSGAVKAVKQLVHSPSHDINLFKAWKQFNHKNPWEWKEWSCSRLDFPKIPMAVDIGGWVVVDIGLVEEMMDGVRWWVLGTEECREEPKHGQTWK